jgi:hypothetical protein
VTRLGEFLGLLKRARRRSRCSVNGCVNRPVRCHSVSLAAGLRPLARAGKVYVLNSHPTVLRARSGRPDVKLEGVHRASTFYGFCSIHDARLFRPIDHQPFRFDPLQAALYLLRAIVHELSKKEISVAVADFLRSTVQDDAWADDLEAGSMWAHAAMLEHVDMLQDALIGRRIDKVKFTAFVSRDPPPLVSSIVWFPDYDFGGQCIQQVPQTAHLPGLLGLFSMPHPEGSVCLVVWHEESDWCAQRLFSSLAANRRDDEIGDALLQLQMAIAENVYFMPDWWDSLPISTREEYFLWWGTQGDIMQPPDPFQANRMRLPGLRWRMHYVRASPLGLTRG